MRYAFVGSLILAASFTVSATADDNETEKVKTMRNEALNDLLAAVDRSDNVAAAYKKLFTNVGLDGLKALAEDEDTSMALQAAWELHRKAVKRDPPIPGRTDWIFGSEPMQAFLKLAAKRLRTDLPVWWGATLMKGEVFPGHHAFICDEGLLPRPVKVTAEKDAVVLTSGAQALTVPKVEYAKVTRSFEFDAAPVILCGEALSFIAGPQRRGYPFEITCVDAKTGIIQWVAIVWAARRGFSTGGPGAHLVELRRHEDTIIVFGGEGCGMYAEGYDAKTGKCKFRFCTGYWFHFSEAWGLK